MADEEPAHGLIRPLEIRCGVGVRQILDPGLASPHHRPVLVVRGRKDVVVLRMHAVKPEVHVPVVVQFGDGMHLPDQRTTRQIAVDHHLEDVVVQVVAGEVPKVIVRLIQEVDWFSPSTSRPARGIEILRITLSPTMTVSRNWALPITYDSGTISQSSARPSMRGIRFAGNWNTRNSMSGRSMPS
jgi:hypothetical protein